jgi:hypothetical protein
MTMSFWDDIRAASIVGLILTRNAYFFEGCLYIFDYCQYPIRYDGAARFTPFRARIWLEYRAYALPA